MNNNRRNFNISFTFCIEDGGDVVENENHDEAVRQELENRIRDMKHLLQGQFASKPAPNMAFVSIRDVKIDCMSPDSIEAAVLKAIREHEGDRSTKTVAGIKRHRELTGSGLFDAHNYVKNLMHIITSKIWRGEIMLEIGFIRKDGSRTYLPGLVSMDPKDIALRCFNGGISQDQFILDEPNRIVSVRFWSCDEGKVREKFLREMLPEDFLLFMEST